MKVAFEILEANYWEHYKFAKELSMFLPIDNPKRIKIEAEINLLLTEINTLKSSIEKN